MLASYPFRALVLKAYSHSLPKARGMETAFSPEGDSVPALILADDTTLLANSQGDMVVLASTLEAWKRVSRAIASAKKFQLCVHPNKTMSSRDKAALGTPGGDYTVVIDDKEIVAVLCAKLLGGILSHPNDIKSPQASLTRRAAMHRSTLSKIDAIHGREVAYLYARACPEAQILGAAAANPCMYSQHEFFVSIQRSLWADSHSSAIGTHPASKTSMIDRLMPGLPWDIAIRVKRLALWQRLRTNSKPGSWPWHLAHTIHNTVALDPTALNRLGGWVRQIHDDLCAWVSPLGLLGPLPAPRIDSHTRRVRSNASAMTPISHDSESMARLTGGVALAMHVSLSAESLRGALSLWKEARWKGSALDLSIFRDNSHCVDAGVEMNQAADDDSEGPWCTETWGLLHDESGWADENHEASKWRLQLLKSATAEVEKRWRLEQVAYAPHNPLLGRGEMALWNRLKPCPMVQDPLLNLDHKKLTVHQRDAVTRLWAGCTLSSNSWCSKLRTNAVWRNPASSDSQRVGAVSCPCGNGPQDSLHCLECSLPGLVNVHDEVLAAGALSLRNSLEAIGSLPWWTRRHKKAQAVMSSKAWDSAPRKRKLELSLGAQDKGIYADIHVCLVSACAAAWARVEDCWSSSD